MKILWSILMMSVLIPHAFARTCDNNFSISTKLDSMKLSAAQMNCVATKEKYQCEKVKEELELEEKNKVISCDAKSLDSNGVMNTDLPGCVWNGIKMSAQQLLDLGTLGKNIAGAISASFQESQICNQSLEKKRELLHAFNLTIDDSRFRLSEQFLGNWLQEASCSEIKKLVFDRYDSYSRTIYRESINNQVANKKARIFKSADNKNDGVSFIEMLKSAMAEANVKYECYTPKVKAEMLCAGVTSLLTDIALGGGVKLAAKGIGAAVKSKKALSALIKAKNAGEKVDLKDAGALTNSDRKKAAEIILERKLSPTEKKAVINAHNVGDGRGFGEYTAKDIAQKGRALKNAETITESERRALMENGIAGTTSIKLSNGEAVRLKGQNLVNEGFERGARDVVKSGVSETKKYYKELSELADADFGKVYTADRQGILNIKLGNEYGLSSKTSANTLEKLIRVNKLDEASTFRSTISSMASTIEEYTAMNTKKYSPAVEYKIYRAKELKAELMERYYAKRYPDEFKELDFDKMTAKKQEILSAMRKDLSEARKSAATKGWPETLD